MGIEAALLGTAATAATSTAAATAATSGLLGVGGAFSLGTTLGTLGTGLGLLSGVQQFAAGNQQAKNAYAQAAETVREQTRQSTLNAYNEKQAAESARRQQKLAYLKSGVSLSGSPLLLLEETRQRGISNANAINTSNSTYTKSVGTQAGQQAGDAYSAGRMGFVRGVTGVLSNYAKVKYAN